ncbi:MAG TPA: TldD/PmbA family protein [Gemmatimonadales bacterium]
MSTDPRPPRLASVSRRDFVHGSSAAVAALAAVPVHVRGIEPDPRAAQSPDSQFRMLAMIGLDAARTAGASYADVRVVRRREQAMSTRDDRVTGLSDAESLGCGIRVLVNGAWGFAASRVVTMEEVRRLAQQAVDQARANRQSVRRPVELAPVRAFPDNRWVSPVREDPFDVSLDEKVGLLLGANAVALGVSGVRFASSSMRFVRKESTFASTEGSVIEQTVYRSYPQMTVTAVARDNADFQSRASGEIAPLGLGYEYVRAANLEERALVWGEQAVEKLSARPVEPDLYDVILHPSNLFLTIHESIGHATELDRALGYEANYAGTTFLAPPADVLNTFRYGPEIMNVQADRTQQGALATVGWDDEGVAADSWPLVKAGVFVDYQTTREQAGLISEHTGISRSHGCAFAQSWNSVPFQRMPNVSLLPGEEGHTLDDLVAATEKGILIAGRGSYSIDQQRYNFQFGGQVFIEVRDGKLVGMLKDVAYQGRTPEFWNSMDMLGGAASYELGGTFGDAKGQPAQANAVSHGCPPARFRNVRVINTGGAS